MNVEANECGLNERMLRVSRPDDARNKKLPKSKHAGYFDCTEDIEAFVFFSPRTSADRAVSALKKIIECIEANGLAIGADEDAEEYFIHEHTTAPTD